MYFKGDIIITDPCYIAKNEQRETEMEYPEKKDYFTYESILDYPDVNVSDYSNLKDILTDKEIHMMKTLTATSKLYEKEEKLYQEKLMEYNKKVMDDWELSEYGENMEILGFSTYITSRTFYGDWTCTTFEKETNKELGQFCADAGMVGVFLLDEVLKYNPDFKEYLEKDWVVTTIKNFEGDIFFSEKQDDLSVEGIGNINFYTKQTGF